MKSSGRGSTIRLRSTPALWNSSPLPHEQDQFLSVTSRDLAARRWSEAAPATKLGPEFVRLMESLGRVLAEDAFSSIDVPGFDRSNLDGYAVRAEDTFGAAEESPVLLTINDEELATGIVPRIEVESGTATPIATGGMLPRGADAVAMVEVAQLCGPSRVLIKKPVAPASGVTFAGTDLARGELAVRAGTRITAREIGVLAAIGAASVQVIRRPRVAILSTGDEIVAAGEPLPLGSIYDSNGAILAASVCEAGGEPIPIGIIGDSESMLSDALARAVAAADLVVLSGGTSKGAGDLCYRVLARQRPGIIVHGVALKPGKPVCLGAIDRTPVAILPGFPTSAIFTFHLFVAPRIRAMSGLGEGTTESIDATLSTRVNSDRGRAEFVLARISRTPRGLVAYPMGKGSGSVTTFSRADGFFSIPEADEFVDAGEPVCITPLGAAAELADLTVIGSHCAGLDMLLGRLAGRGIRSRTLWVGSQGGLSAIGRDECDIAGVHLLDPATGIYNQPFLAESARLVPGYGRMQGIVSRPNDRRFVDRETLARTFGDGSVAMVNRNRGSGTRVLIDELLSGARPPGHAIEARSHHAVCAAVAQGRADWGVAIETVARQYGLSFLALRDERYDFAIPKGRWDDPAVIAFRFLLTDPEVRACLTAMGFSP